MPLLALPLDVAEIARSLQLDVLARLATATALGAAIGVEREIHGKQAGLRTHTLIALGAALLTVMSIRIPAAFAAAYHVGDPGRIASNIATGVGFLGAGVILHSRGRIIGLTTAATIWVVAAIGVAAGAGEYVPALGTAVMVLVVLVPLRWFEGRAARARMRAADERRRNRRP
jgi:putative Mg2+ transporter-C (MgtC) family protein